MPNSVEVRQAKPRLGRIYRRHYFHFLLSYQPVMEDFIADEVESILYIAREISGMPYSFPHVVPTQEGLQYIGSRL